MTELKPCPFCGGTPYMAQNYLGQMYVRCPECGACVWGRDTDDWSIDKMGEKIFTFTKAAIVQKTTQKNSGGMSDIYLDMGTYLKSFYSVMYSPSCVKISKTEAAINEKI